MHKEALRKGQSVGLNAAGSEIKLSQDVIFYTLTQVELAFIRDTEAINARCDALQVGGQVKKLLCQVANGLTTRSYLREDPDGSAQIRLPPDDNLKTGLECLMRLGEFPIINKQTREEDTSIPKEYGGRNGWGKVLNRVFLK